MLFRCLGHNGGLPIQNSSCTAHLYSIILHSVVYFLHILFSVSTHCINSVFPNEEDVKGILQMHANLKINKRSLQKKVAEESRDKKITMFLRAKSIMYLKEVCIIGAKSYKLLTFNRKWKHGIETFCGTFL